MKISREYLQQVLDKEITGGEWRDLTAMALAAYDMAEALEAMKHIVVHCKADGGVFDPKLGDFKMSPLYESVYAPAEEALKKWSEL